MTEDQKYRLARLLNLKKDEAADDVVYGIEIALEYLGHGDAVRECAEELRRKAEKGEPDECVVGKAQQPQAQERRVPA